MTQVKYGLKQIKNDWILFGIVALCLAGCSDPNAPVDPSRQANQNLEEQSVPVACEGPSKAAEALVFTNATACARNGSLAILPRSRSANSTSVCTVRSIFSDGQFQVEELSRYGGVSYRNRSELAFQVHAIQGYESYIAGGRVLDQNDKIYRINRVFSNGQLFTNLINGYYDEKTLFIRDVAIEVPSWNGFRVDDVVIDQNRDLYRVKLVFSNGDLLVQDATRYHSERIMNASRLARQL